MLAHGIAVASFKPNGEWTQGMQFACRNDPFNAKSVRRIQANAAPALGYNGRFPMVRRYLS